MPNYTLNLPTGEPLTVVYTFESNGKGNKSNPFVVTIDRQGIHPTFVVDNDLTYRAKAGFEFTIKGQHIIDGVYTAIADSVLINNRTHIPVDYIPLPPPAPRGVTTSELPPFILLTYTVPNAATSLMLLGSGVPSFNDDISWGHAVQQNFINVLSHNAAPTPPISPLVGQIWYDTDSDSLCVFTTNKSFKRIITLQALEAFVTMKTNSMLGQRVEFAPAHSDSDGSLGDWFSDNSYIYVCGTEGWRRTATETF